jgi:hypothetical protein
LICLGFLSLARGISNPRRRVRGISLIFLLTIMTSIQTAELYAKPRLQHMIRAWFQDGSRDASTIITDFLLEHKQPAERFVIYPQLSLRWKPNKPKDNREEVPDIGIGNFTLQTPGFKNRALRARAFDGIRRYCAQTSS